MTAAAPTRPIPILLYHGVAADAEGPDAPWVVTPDEFERHLDVLADEGIRTVTIRDLVHRVHEVGRPLEPGTVALTFDDGFADFATGAWPLLDRRGLASTLYVTTAGVGSTAFWLPGSGPRRPMLDWPALADLAAGGVEIGGHTHTHPQLDLLDLAAARQEIRRGRQALEERLRTPVTSFAYPHGYHTPALRSIVAEEGFTSACGVGHAFSSVADDRFALARIMVRHGDSLDDIRRWVRGEGLPTRPRGRRRVLAAGWRQIRRHQSSARRSPMPAEGARC